MFYVYICECVEINKKKVLREKKRKRKKRKNICKRHRKQKLKVNILCFVRSDIFCMSAIWFKNKPVSDIQCKHLIIRSHLISSKLIKTIMTLFIHENFCNLQWKKSMKGKGRKPFCEKYLRNYALYQITHLFIMSNKTG